MYEHGVWRAEQRGHIAAGVASTQTWRPISADPTPVISSAAGHVQPSLKRAREKLLTYTSFRSRRHCEDGLKEYKHRAAWPREDIKLGSQSALQRC